MFRKSAKKLKSIKTMYKKKKKSTFNSVLNIEYREKRFHLNTITPNL